MKKGITISLAIALIMAIIFVAGFAYSKTAIAAPEVICSNGYVPHFMIPGQYHIVSWTSLNGNFSKATLMIPTPRGQWNTYKLTSLATDWNGGWWGTLHVTIPKGTYVNAWLSVINKYGQCKMPLGPFTVADTFGP